MLKVAQVVNEGVFEVRSNAAVNSIERGCFVEGFDPSRTAVLTQSDNKPVLGASQKLAYQ
jgi:hypothetical protein